MERPLTPGKLLNPEGEATENSKKILKFQNLNSSIYFVKNKRLKII